MAAPQTLPMQERRQALLPSSVNAEARTVEVIWTTGAAVPRVRWDGWDGGTPFMEELIVSAAAIDLSRLNSGAPVLESHDSSTTDNQVAVVERAWIEGGVGKALVRFPSEGTSDKSDTLFKLVQQGIVRNISVGYRIEKLKIVAPKKEGDLERHIAERWFPFEISFVTVPADAGAQVRSLGDPAPVAIVFDSMAEAAQARMRMRMAGL